MRTAHAATLVLALSLFLISTLASRPLAPLLVAENAADRIDGEYLVMLRQDMPRTQLLSLVKSLKLAIASVEDGSELKNMHSIGDSFVALYAKLTPAMVERLRGHPAVALIEENQVVRINQEVCHQQQNVIWNLDRIDTHDIDLVDDNYNYNYAGQGVDAYIIDTGILTTHIEFDGRAEWGANFADTVEADCNGHGTHVAGTVAGELYGVAKNASVIAVKVLACSGSGTYEGVIKGIEWTANEARKRGRPSVANMSLGGGKAATVNAAVAAAVKSGVTFVVAAGNENTDACSRSPASEPLAITVAATTIGSDSTGASIDRRASFSNFGTCVDIAAPGQLIKAAWIDQSGYPPNTVFNTISGTSMASPHVAGVVALILSKNPTFTPAEVEAALYADSTNGVLDLACPSFGSARTECLKTPNKLLYTNC